MVKDIWLTIEPTLVDFLVVLATALVSALSYKGIQLLDKTKQLTVAKIGTTNYNIAREVAIGIYKVLEDDFKDTAKAGDLKRKEMEKKLKDLFPSLTQTQLDAINKEVCAVYSGELKATGLLEQAK